MQACLAAKNTNIKHAELPQALITVDKKRKWDKITPTPRMVTPPNIPPTSASQHSPVHPLIKQKIVDVVLA
eukprot:10629903-Ditylum_brightwellii.AAC.1